MNYKLFALIICFARFFSKVTVCIFLTLSFAKAQSPKADSLQKVLENYSKRDTQYINLLNETGFAYYTSTPKKTLQYGKEALALAQKLRFKKGIAKAYNTLGVAHLVTGKYPEAIAYYTKALEMYRKAKNYQKVANLWFNLGVVASNQAKYDVAINYYLKAVKHFQSTNNTKAMASCYNNLGVAYKKRNEYKDAANYYRLALEKHQQVGFQIGIASAYTNLGRISQVMKKYDDALDYFDKALDISLKIGNKRAQAACYHNTGEVKAILNQHKEAISFFEKSNKLEEELGNPNTQALTCNALGKSYRILKQYDKSAKYLKKGHSLAAKSGSRDVLKQNYLFQSRLDSTMGNTLEALASYQKYTALKDSIFNQQKSAQIAQMKTQFETEQKENQILLLEQKQKNQQSTIQRQNLIILLICLGMATALFLVFVVYRFYRIKKKSNEQLVQLNNELYQQQDEIITQRDFIEDQRQQLEKQHYGITQSLKAANHLQRATFPNPNDIAHILPQHFVFFKPKNIVSGDFYWVEKIDKKTFVVVGDGTGHGVIGAFMAMLATALLDRIIKSLRVTEPTSILTMMNREVRNILHQQDNNNQNGMDLGICVFEELTDENDMLELTFGGAKRPLWYAYPGIEDVGEIAGSRKAIGGFLKSKKEFTQQKIQLPRNTTFYMFSDGYPDQNNVEREKFSQESFKKLICNMHLKPLEEQNAILESTLAEYMQGTEQRDDMAVMGWTMS